MRTLILPCCYGPRAALPADRHGRQMLSRAGFRLMTVASGKSHSHPSQGFRIRDATHANTDRKHPAEPPKAPRPGVPPTAPFAPPPTQEQVSALVDFINSQKKLLVLTGAGISTESNIPDYRSAAGAYSSGYKPMTHQEFMANEANRRRYWARSFAGWQRFARQTRPNAAHDAIARMHAAGRVWKLLTQNVDRLHQSAGVRHVLEMHGTTHEVICMDCGDITCRHEMQSRLEEMNPGFLTRKGDKTVPGMEQARPSVGRVVLPGQVRPDGDTDADIRPDGDTEAADAEPEASELASEPRTKIRRADGTYVDSYEGFKFHPCLKCGGVLKPDVVFFGDNLPKHRTEATMSAAAEADALLVVGSSLMVYSAFRIAKAVADRGKGLAIVNVGPTRADSLATLKIEALAGELLPRAVAEGGLDFPNLHW